MLSLPALVLVPAALCTPAEEPWTSLLIDATRGLRLEYLVRPSESGLVLQLRNGGAQALRFGLRLSGEPMPQVQARERERGRFHLDPGARARIPLGVAPSGIEVFELALGEGN